MQYWIKGTACSTGLNYEPSETHSVNLNPEY